MYSQQLVNLTCNYVEGILSKMRPYMFCVVGKDAMTLWCDGVLIILLCALKYVTVWYGEGNSIR